MIVVLAPILLFIAFLLLLLVSLSVPIIKTIFLFRLKAQLEESFTGASANGDVTFGVWGYCTGAAEASAFGFSTTRDGSCSRPRLGFELDNQILEILGLDDNLDALNRVLTAALVLHPIACGITFIALVISLFMLRRGSNGLSARLPSFLTLGFGALAGILTTAVFLIDVIMVAILRSRVRDQTEGQVTAVWGNAVWMTLGATVATWLAICGACCGMVIGRRRSRNKY